MAKQRVALNTVSSQTHSYAFCARCDFDVFSGGKTRKRAVDTHGSRDFLFRALIPSSRRRGPQMWVVRGGTERSPLSSPPSSSGKLPTASLALRFCGIAIHARGTDTGAGRTCACSVQFYMQFRGGRRSPQDGGVFNYI